MVRGAGMIWSARRRCAIPVMCTRPADSASIGSASRRANGALRRVGIVGVAVLAVMALGADPDANADPPPGCPQGPVPGPGPFPGCGNEGAFLADIGAAGFGDVNGKPVALQQGRDICRLMDAGLSRQDMVNQFSALNTGLGPDGAAQVVEIAIRDLCPWHR
jgi:Protein of unknown function (DUF732)